MARQSLTARVEERLEIRYMQVTRVTRSGPIASIADAAQALRHFEVCRHGDSTIRRFSVFAVEAHSTTEAV